VYQGFCKYLDHNYAKALQLSDNMFPSYHNTQVDNLDKSQLVAEEEAVEQDDLNTHEVMSTLTQLLTHMERNNITPAVDEVS